VFAVYHAEVVAHRVGEPFAGVGAGGHHHRSRADRQ
jgi:hypothetical protein